MNALYFRHLFQNTKRGTAHTVSVSSAEGEFFLCSLCSNGLPLRDRERADEKFQMEGQIISVLVLERLHPVDLEKVRDILKHNKVERVFIPYGDSAAELSELSLAGDVKLLEAGETVSFQEKGWDVWIKCLDNGSQGALVLYHGLSEASREGKDCLMAVKPAEKDLPCRVCVDQNNHACAMKCCLYNDFALCKGHNGKDAEEYVTGALLLGNVNLKEKEKELRKDLKEHLSDIRMIALGEGGSEARTSDSFMEFLNRGNDRLNQYYILSEGMEENEHTLKTILKEGPRRIPVLTSENTGLCISGFLKDKEAV